MHHPAGNWLAAHLIMAYIAPGSLTLSPSSSMISPQIYLTLDLNGNGQLCNKFAPTQAQGNIVGVAIDDVAFAVKP